MKLTGVLKFKFTQKEAELVKNHHSSHETKDMISYKELGYFIMI